MSKYRKFFVAASGVLVALGEAFADGSIDMTDAGQILAAVALAYGVYRVPNAISFSAEVADESDESAHATVDRFWADGRGLND